MQRYKDVKRQTSVGGHSGRKCGGGFAEAFWFNHLVRSFSHRDTGGRWIVAALETVMPV
jgi:hypothetical protein